MRLGHYQLTPSFIPIPFLLAISFIDLNFPPSPKNPQLLKKKEKKGKDRKTHVCQAGIKDNSFWKSVKHAPSIYSTYIRFSTMRCEKSPVVEVEGVETLYVKGKLNAYGELTIGTLL